MTQHPPAHSDSHSVLPRGAIWPFALLASCFLWWGIANNLTDPLVKVFKEIFGMSTFQAALIQMAFYGGYFCMALPGAMIARRFNYKTGVLVGLGLYAATDSGGSLSDRPSRCVEVAGDKPTKDPTLACSHGPEVRLCFACGKVAPAVC
jgi:hypothetical protein